MSTKLIENTVKLAVRDYRKKTRKEKKRLVDDIYILIKKWEDEQRRSAALARALAAERQTVQQYSDYLMETDNALQRTEQELATAEDDKTWLNNKLTETEEKLAMVTTIAEVSIKNNIHTIDMLEKTLQ